MGNRAIIRPQGNMNKGVYLHWNGGRDSVEAFLKYCELRGFRSFEDSYGMARFVQVVSNFFGGGLSIGIVDYPESHGDNGVYIVKGWEIVGREDYDGPEQDTHDMEDMLKAIDEAQPKKQQLGEYLDAEEVWIEEVQERDKVFVQELDGTMKAYEVIGFGYDEVVNGSNVKGRPLVNRFKGGSRTNPNNYVSGKVKRIKEETYA
jgi:hypothetical protein